MTHRERKQQFTQGNILEADKSTYDIRDISFADAKDFCVRYHYAHGMHNGPTACYGLFDSPASRVLTGVCVFNTPCSEQVRAAVFGHERRDAVTELGRLVIWDVTPRYMESWFIARALKRLKRQVPRIEAVVSFADPTAGHVGTIYQSTNARYYGQSKYKDVFYLDPTGGPNGEERLRHPRQCGVNISRAEALERGWVPVRREAKHRYCFVVPEEPEGKFLSKRERTRISLQRKQELEERVLLPALPYPDRPSTVNGIIRS